MANQKMLNLIKALNEAKGNISNETSIMFVEQDEEGKVMGKYFIKLRPVRDEDGVETMEFVAREQ